MFSPYCDECIDRINTATDLLAREDLITGWVTQLQVRRDKSVLTVA